MAEYDNANGNDTMHRPDDAIAMLKADHLQGRTLFRQYEETPDPYLKQIIAEHIFAELELHALLEETVFYPALAEQGDEEGERLVERARQDHQLVREMIAELRDIDDDEAFEARFHALRDHVDQHVEEEERAIFPKAEQALAAHLEDLMDAMVELKKQLLAS